MDCPRPSLKDYDVYRNRSTDCNPNATPVLKVLYWLPIKNRVQLKILTRTYDALLEQDIIYKYNILPAYEPRKTPKSIDSMILAVPKVLSSSYSKRKCQYSADKRLNALSAHIRESQTLNTENVFVQVTLWSLICSLFF